MVSRIKGRAKFSNVDILAFMGNVVQKHTRYYQSDFEIDKEILHRVAETQEQQDKTFIWLVMPYPWNMALTGKERVHKRYKPA